MKRWLWLSVLGIVAAAWAADELTVNQGWTYSKNGRSRVLAPSATKFTIAGNGVVENVQSISTNAIGDALVLGGVTNAGFAWFRNSSTSNYVEIGAYDADTNFMAFLKLNTNEAQTCWLGVAAPRARANTAEVRLDYVIMDR